MFKSKQIRADYVKSILLLIKYFLKKILKIFLLFIKWSKKFLIFSHKDTLKF